MEMCMFVCMVRRYINACMHKIKLTMGREWEMEVSVNPHALYISLSIHLIFTCS